MNAMYVLCNQQQQYLEKSGEWGLGNDNRAIYRTAHKDEAINQKVELTVKNPALRITICELESNEKGLLSLPTQSADSNPKVDQPLVTPEVETCVAPEQAPILEANADAKTGASSSEPSTAPHEPPTNQPALVAQQEAQAATQAQQQQALV